MTGRERVRARLTGRRPDRVPLMPITMMFASDHYGSKYRDYATDARVLAAAQIRTAETFGFDYVSAISDPAREAADLGAAVEWFDDQPPAIIESDALLSDKGRLASLAVPDPCSGRRMSNRLDAIRLLREKAGTELLVEGWVEGPCAEAADLRGLNRLMLDFTDDPDFVNALMDFAVEMAIGFARAQRDAGADIVGIGDAAASLVGPRIYTQFVQPREARLIEALHEMGLLVRLHICGNTRRLLAGMGATGADMIDLDHPSPVAEGRAAMGPDQVLCGNVDPVRGIRDGSPESVKAAFARCYAEAGAPYIVGAGCEIPRGTPPANVHAMAEFARAAG